MSLLSIDGLGTLWTELQGLARALPHLARISSPDAACAPATLLREHGQKRGAHPALLFEDRRYTWADVDREVDRAARALFHLGIREGDTVAVLMDNRPEFLFAVTGLNRIGAAGALINTNITGKALAHAIRIAEPAAVLVGAEHADKTAEVLPELPALSLERMWCQRDGATTSARFASFDEAVERQSDGPFEQKSPPRAGDRFGYIYTSGTTGLPKAALITNQRILAPGALVGRGVFDLTPEDVAYVTTPLYHSVGMFIGWGGALSSGATIALRRKFSASGFWTDVERFEATAFVYIGELCRYLLNQPEHPSEHRHQLRIAGGNGLRPDIWQPFQERFRIPLIREYYGATEGAAMCVNMTGRPGMVGRLLPGMSILRCDAETGEPFRNAQGRCEAGGAGETGLLVGKITSTNRFDGYADREATRKKILEGVFADGDQYFNTGDLLTLHDDRWLSFADRVGDTFRWKGENVSTNEVAELLNGAPGVLESNVYGVQIPGTDGRAGMASIHHDDDFDIGRFAEFVHRELPVYMRPYFLRLQREMQITVTFKHKKVDYRREAYDPGKVADPLFLLEGDRYLPLDAEVYAALQDGRRQIR